MPEFLLELLSEEIPARMQMRGADDLKRMICDSLNAAGLEYSEARSFVTPRRLTLVVDGLPISRPDITEEKRGPRVGAPGDSIHGFLKSLGLSSLDQAVRKDTGKGEFWFAVVTKKGGATSDILAATIRSTLKAFSWPKSMKWGSGTFSWVRPLRSIVAVFDGEIVRGEIELGGDMKSISFGNQTRGHRFFSMNPITVCRFSDYSSRLRDSYVMLDPSERRETIVRDAQNICLGAGIDFEMNDELLDEIVGLVEWPVPRLGRIDRTSMDLPEEVLTVSMRVHQRYLPTRNYDGSLSNAFVVVTNSIGINNEEKIVDGNERVLRARLSDAKFFWDQDRKTTLESRLPELEKVVYHAKLGTQAERVERIAKLSAQIAKFVPHADVALVDRAARLCKADLVSGLVGEFPELQGVMGRYYALNDGLPREVAAAIGEHYSPVGPKDRCPTAPTSVAVALADKFDSLVGFWANGEKPTGSKDPFALRRAALGIIRIIETTGLRIRLHVPIVHAYANLPKSVDDASRLIAFIRRLEAVDKARRKKLSKEAQKEIFEEVSFEVTKKHVDELIQFFVDRLKVQARDRGMRHDVIDAVFASGRDDDLVRLLARVEALQSFLAEDAGKNLLAGYRRAANIVRTEERKDKTLPARISGLPDFEKLEVQEEKTLFTKLKATRLDKKIEEENFVEAMTELAGLRTAIDEFFEKVTVNVVDNEDLRLNRLKLLNVTRAIMDSVADFSKIEG